MFCQFFVLHYYDMQTKSFECFKIVESGLARVEAELEIELETALASNEAELDIELNLDLAFIGAELETELACAEVEPEI